MAEPELWTFEPDAQPFGELARPGPEPVMEQWGWQPDAQPFAELSSEPEAG